jgi:hypothetical protein
MICALDPSRRTGLIAGTGCFRHFVGVDQSRAMPIVLRRKRHELVGLVQGAVFRVWTMAESWAQLWGQLRSL